jgi:predicted RNA-binding Zn-ribbon protein involved in translation (DUF1610 family)
MAVLKKVIVGTDGCVTCPTCAYEIFVLKTATLPREFSTLCPNCGARKIYPATEIHDRKQAEQAVQLRTKTEFGRRTAIDSAQMAANLEQPKSRFGEVASWLLK